MQKLTLLHSHIKSCVMINTCTHSHVHGLGWQAFHQENSGEMKHRQVQSSWTQTQALNLSILLGEEGKQFLSLVLDSLMICIWSMSPGTIIHSQCPQGNWSFAWLKLQSCLAPEPSCIHELGMEVGNEGHTRVLSPRKRTARCFY